MLKIKFLFYILLLFSQNYVLAQLNFSPLHGNYHLQNLIQPKTINTALNKTAAAAPLDLPFLDDFAYMYKSPYPNQLLWLDSNVYINNTLPISPISIGVASFDGLDKWGYPYNLNAFIGTSNHADKLTSAQINLKKNNNVNYTTADSIYLSFFYQSTGRGDDPETDDSLCVDFLNTITKKWTTVWRKAGFTPPINDSTFYQVFLPIKDLVYFDSTFQFRFRNKATLSGSVDNWHIDYVYINKNRTIKDTLVPDVSFVYESTPFLKKYSQIPYTHFTTQETSTFFRNIIRNSNPTAANVIYYFNLLNQSNISKYNYNAAESINPYTSNGYQNVASQCSINATTYTLAPLQDSVITLQHFLRTSAGDFSKQNDTVIQKIYFRNTYAYDDGSAEIATYCNVYGARIVVRYTINKKDTIRGLKIFFDPIIDGHLVLNATFRINIWDDINNKPGNLIYKDSLMSPNYLKGKNNTFATYNLSSCFTINPGTYYFGIQQTTSQPLNIGFDKNNNSGLNTFIDVGNGFINPNYKGSLMINPIIGCKTLVGVNELNTITTPIIYPNPTNDILNLELPNGIIKAIEVINTLGQSQIKIKNINESKTHINLIDLTAGIYFIKIVTSQNKSIIKKIILNNIK